MASLPDSTMDINKVEFSQLCTGSVRGYSFNLVDLGTDTPISSMEQKLKGQMERTVRELARRRRIAKMYIGKTYIPQAQGEGYVAFDHLNPSTWEMTGISSCWRQHHRQDHGRDGLVVLCTITGETLPRRSRMSPADLALAMEQRLLQHSFFIHDSRVANETFTTEHLTEVNHHAYAIYIVFRCEEASDFNARNSTSKAEDKIENSSLLGDSPPQGNSPPDDSLLDSSPESTQEAQNEPSNTLRAEDEVENDSLLLRDSSLDSFQLESLFATLCDSASESTQREHEAQNDPPRAEDEIENGSMLGDSPPQGDSPPDNSLLDSASS